MCAGIPPLSFSLCAGCVTSIFFSLSFKKFCQSGWMHGFVWSFPQPSYFLSILSFALSLSLSLSLSLPSFLSPPSCCPPALLLGHAHVLSMCQRVCYCWSVSSGGKPGRCVQVFHQSLATSTHATPAPNPLPHSWIHTTKNPFSELWNN